MHWWVEKSGAQSAGEMVELLVRRLGLLVVAMKASLKVGWLADALGALLVEHLALKMAKQ